MKTVVKIILLFVVLMATAEAGRFDRYREQEREDRGFKRTSTKKRCPMDLVLVLDASGALQDQNVTWQDIQGYAKKLINGIGYISEIGTHVGVMRYSCIASVDISLNKYKGVQYDASNIKDDIDGLAQFGGKPFIEKALAKVDNMFTEEAGMRDVPKVCVFITTGIQTGESGLELEFDAGVKMLKKAGKPLKDKGVEVFSLGIGVDMNVWNVIAIASNPGNVAGVDDIPKLVRKIKKYRKDNC